MKRMRKSLWDNYAPLGGGLFGLACVSEPHFDGFYTLTYMLVLTAMLGEIMRRVRGDDKV